MNSGSKNRFNRHRTVWYSQNKHAETVETKLKELGPMVFLWSWSDDHLITITSYAMGTNKSKHMALLARVSGQPKRVVSTVAKFSYFIAL